jgi:predicted NUDIX family NTP pyrophosphohydrolase
MDRFGWFDLPAAHTKIFDSQAVFLDRLAAAAGDAATGTSH